MRKNCGNRTGKSGASFIGGEHFVEALLKASAMIWVTGAADFNVTCRPITEMRN
jgi:hypothetical protein